MKPEELNGDRGAARVDQLDHLQLGLSGNAVDGRSKPSKNEVELWRFDGSLRRLDLSLAVTTLAIAAKLF